MVIHFCSDIWRGYTPPAQNTQIHAVTYAPTLLWLCFFAVTGSYSFETKVNSGKFSLISGESGPKCHVFISQE